MSCCCLDLHPLTPNVEVLIESCWCKTSRPFLCTTLDGLLVRNVGR